MVFLIFIWMHFYHLYRYSLYFADFATMVISIAKERIDCDVCILQNCKQ